MWPEKRRKWKLVASAQGISSQWSLYLSLSIDVKHLVYIRGNDKKLTLWSERLPCRYTNNTCLSSHNRVQVVPSRLPASRMKRLRFLLLSLRAAPSASLLPQWYRKAFLLNVCRSEKGLLLQCQMLKFYRSSTFFTSSSCCHSILGVRNSVLGVLLFILIWLVYLPIFR